MSDYAAGQRQSPAARLLARLDRVVAFTVVALVALALFAPGQLLPSLRFTAAALLAILPFLAASILFAAGSKASGLDQPIAAVFRKNQVTAIVLAALLGALSPFCSCGVIPIIAGLLQAGVPLAPVMAFWIASPLMDPEMFILMVGGIGFEFTIAKMAAAAALGLASGFTVLALSRSQAMRNPLNPGLAACGSGCGPKQGDTSVAWTFWREPHRKAVFAEAARDTGWFLFKWLTLAFLIESLMVAYVPPDLVARWLGGGEWWVIPAASGIGIPAYLNGYAAIPLVRGLMDIGMLPGAGLAFMIAGGVTSIPAAMAVYVAVNRQVFAVYLALGLAGAIVSGFAYQAYLAL
ncbi:MAG: permease [Hyphomicrobiales bacterium]